MLRTILILPALLLASQADAQTSPDASAGRTQTFIAPSGEPFRVTGNVPYPVAQWFQGADKNGDGKLDLDEFTADFLRFFDQLDVNHDGGIDGVERARYENQIAPETLDESVPTIAQTPAGPEDDFDVAGQGAAARGDGPMADQRSKPKYGLHPIGAAKFDLLGLPEPVASMDTELRGRISRRVATEVAQSRFAQLDDQHRGYLTLDTLPDTFAQRRHMAVEAKAAKRR